MKNLNSPIVVDLGSASRKRLRKLKQRVGKLEAEVHSVLEQIRAKLGNEPEAHELLPVVVIYSRKSKTRGSLIDLIP